MEIRARNVNDGIAKYLKVLKDCAFIEKEKQDTVICFTEPVMTVFERPAECVLFWGEHSGNPIYNLMDAVWFFAGKSVVTQEQLLNIIKDLNSNKTAVLCLKEKDIFKKHEEFESLFVFEIKRDTLSLTVFSSSNDFWNNEFGPDVVKYGMLMSFISAFTKTKIGNLYHFSNKAYGKKENIVKHLTSLPDASCYDAYSQGVLGCQIINYSDPSAFLRDCEYFSEDPTDARRYYYNSFFYDVAYPVAMINKIRKQKTGDGMYWADRIKAQDWKIAICDWIERKVESLK